MSKMLIGKRKHVTVQTGAVDIRFHGKNMI